MTARRKQGEQQQLEEWERSVLEAAYDDQLGVTAEFNLNLLDRINRELDGDFQLEQFSHRAHYDHDRGRIEMHLVSATDQVVSICGESRMTSRG